MNIKNMFFSPTYSTERISKILVDSLGYKFKNYDISLLSKKELSLELDEEDLLIVSMPVYAGRIPSIALNKLEKIKGNNTKAIIMVIYGNRDYDDALLELKDFMEDRNFQIIGAAAVIAEHSIVNEIAKDRPDNSDVGKIQEFANEIKDRLNSNEFIDIQPKGNPEYREATDSGAKASSIEEKCIDCGICFNNCPVKAISKDKKYITNDNCILCMRCIKICPENARFLDEDIYEGIKNKIMDSCKYRKEPEFF